MPTPPPELSPLDARIVAVLVEKERTVPDTYPLTLNALVAGCNQKTSRDPVMSVTEGEVQDAIERLRRQTLVIESSGGRAMRYAQNLRRVLGVPAESVALLATLVLRGAQTAAELRLNCDRLQRFSDPSALEAFLAELAEWSAGALVVRLPRRPGEREPRWAHLLCGPVAADDTGDPVPGQPGAQDAVRDPGRLARLEDRVAELSETLALLRDEVDALRTALAGGPGRPGPG